MVKPLGRLHLITDTRQGRDALAVVSAAVGAGAPVVQVRVEDETSDRQAYEFARRVREICDRYGAVCLVNDRLDVAVAVGAAGGHVGADDLPVAAARRVLGSAAVLGATCRDPESARAAVAAGASYLGVGPAYQSSTKPDLPEPIGPHGVQAVAAAVPQTPVIAIGGITAERVEPLLVAGGYGIAVVGAINDAADPAAATGAFLSSLSRAGTPSAPPAPPRSRP